MPSEHESPDDEAAHWSPIESQEWYAARNAVSALRDVLIAAGMERDFPISARTSTPSATASSNSAASPQRRRNAWRSCCAWP